MRKSLLTAALIFALTLASIPASADGPSEQPGGAQPTPTPCEQCSGGSGGGTNATTSPDDESFMEWVGDFIESLFG